MKLVGKPEGCNRICGGIGTYSSPTAEHLAEKRAMFSKPHCCTMPSSMALQSSGMCEAPKSGASTLRLEQLPAMRPILAANCGSAMQQKAGKGQVLRRARRQAGRKTGGTKGFTKTSANGTWSQSFGLATRLRVGDWLHSIEWSHDYPGAAIAEHHAIAVMTSTAASKTHCRSTSKGWLWICHTPKNVG